MGCSRRCSAALRNAAELNRYGLNMNRDEKEICNLLGLHDLSAESFSKEEKRRRKTPDFRVSHGREFRFFCEVKSIDKDLWLDKRLDMSPSGVIVGESRNDPIYNRLTDDIHTAVKQFDAVNAELTYPNVLSWVNHDRHCGFLDLIAVLTGNALTDDGGALPIFQQFSEGRIRGEKARIHLYIWLDEFKPKRLLFNQAHQVHHQTLCNLFGVDPASIKQIRS